MAGAYACNDLQQALPEQPAQNGHASVAGDGVSQQAVGWEVPTGSSTERQEHGEQPSAASAEIYAWDDEYGDVGPKIPQLELELFGKTESRGQGLDFSK